MRQIHRLPRVFGLSCLLTLALASVLLDAQIQSWGRQFGTTRPDQATGIAFLNEHIGKFLREW